jgi:hypothetical protein
MNILQAFATLEKKLAASSYSSSMLKTAAVDAININRYLTAGSSEATHMAAENLKPSISSSDSHPKNATQPPRSLSSSGEVWRTLQ